MAVKKALTRRNANDIEKAVVAPLKKTKAKKASTSGYSKTATNRITGEKSTTTGKLTPVTKEEYVGTGKMMKTKKKR